MAGWCWRGRGKMADIGVCREEMVVNWEGLHDRLGFMEVIVRDEGFG